MPVSTTEQEEVQVQVTRVLVESYFDIVRKNLQDAVPKARSAPGALLLGTLFQDMIANTSLRQQTAFELCSAPASKLVAVSC